MTTGSQFPRKTAAALATAVLLLVAIRRFNAGKGLDPAIFADAAKVKLFRHPPAPTVATQTNPAPLNGVQRPPALKAATAREPISANFVDDSGALDPFFAALYQLELPPDQKQAAKPQVVTILHYGDSPTTADLITGDIRQTLQSQFGNAGDGFLLAAKPWAWYQHRGVDLNDHGWTISTAVGKGREEVYGIGGASFEGTSGASTRISIKDGSQTAMEVAYLARPNGGTFSVSTGGSELASISTAAEAAHPAFRRVALPPGTKSVDLKPTSGAVRLYGEDLLTERRGILYDSLGLNGASTSVLSNGFNAAAWTAALQHEAPALVIVNYGTNESSFGPYVDKYYEPSLRTSIARIRAALPNVPILIMSPMDRGQRTGVDQIATFDTIPRIVAIQRSVAAEQKCAFFDTFDAMGGDGTMSRWYSAHPRLVAGDLIHPTPQGAAIVAQLFVRDLLLGYDRYLRRQPGYQSRSHALPLPPEPAKIPEKPSAVPKREPPASKPLEPLHPEPPPTVQPEATPPTDTPKAPEHDEQPPAEQKPPLS